MQFDAQRPPGGSTLVGILRSRSEDQGGRFAYTFLPDGEAGLEHITFAELDSRARAIAAHLQVHTREGSRALLLFPPGFDYIAAFFGCLYAKIVAVPLYPPKRNQMRPGSARIAAILSDAQPAIALGPASVLALASKLIGPVSMQMIATDELSDGLSSTWREPAITGSDLAFLQYTSGSTAAPKGVMLTHHNLIHNSLLMRQCFALDSSSRSLIWLPPYHDMGLIGGILAPLVIGFHSTLMSPVHFLQRPSRWLQAISRQRATISGGPNFAYDLCARKISLEERATMDLSSWRVAFNGAEPIRPDTLERFSRIFAPSGFRSEAFSPCYGLAEATLIVSGSRAGAPPVVADFQLAAADVSGAAETYLPDRDGRCFVSSGVGFEDQQVAIVDPAALTPCGPGQVGEIWVRGQSISPGYWNKPQETAQIFHAFLDGRGPFLRTGDLGFLHGSELFVTGRIKDLIIIRGRNSYPQDIELTVERSSPMLRAGAGAAFAIPAGGEERLVIVHEIEREHLAANPENLVQIIRQNVVQEHDLQPYAVALIRPGSIPKTSSGKIQHYACRAAFLDGALKLVACSSVPDSLEQDEPIPLTNLTACSPAERRELLERYLKAEVARSSRMDIERVDAGRPLLTLGVDSLTAVELQHRLEGATGLHLPFTALLSDLSIRDIVSTLSDSGANQSIALPPITPAHFADSDRQPLSEGQRALWFLHQVAPTGSAYNIVTAMKASAELDIRALERALVLLVERHAVLRTLFSAQDGEPFQRLQQETRLSVHVEDAAQFTEDMLDRRMHQLAAEPFDLENGPLFRVHLLRRGPSNQILVFCIHHIITDFWSMALLARDLSELYRSETARDRAALPPLPLAFADYIRWQAAMLESAEGERLWAYWSRKLSGELPILNLPTDRSRPAVQTYNGAAVSLRLGPDLTQRIKSFSQQQGATLYTMLVAAFQVLLSRYTETTDVLVGSPTAGRGRAEFDSVAGYFVNPVVLRADLTANPSFREFLSQVRQTVTEALDHQAFPFALLANRLQPVRDPSRPPVFQAMFMLHKAPAVADTDLALFALGEPGGELHLGDILLESLEFAPQAAQFDLTLAVAEASGSLHASLQYNTDLFDASTVTRMLGHFASMLEGAILHPEQPVALLPLLTEAERQQLLVEWNNTSAAGPEAGTCIHHLFESQAARTPHAAALVFERLAFTFDELNRLANRAAHHLRSLGVGPETPVAVMLERSPNLVVSLLAILKAGGAYVPLDPAYPPDRLSYMLNDCGAQVLIADRHLASVVAGLDSRAIHTVLLDSACQSFAYEDDHNPINVATGQNLAYIIYTSGSTGVPKGVMVQHSSVVNFFGGMDRSVQCSERDTLLAVTSISFDISVLELFWTLSRGARVVLLRDPAASPVSLPRRFSKQMQFSIFYFASDSPEPQADKYRLILEGAKFADRHGFTAVWTPERHFHEFGGLYPNPSVLSATLAGITERVQIRAGSVVLPLHDPIRVAEEWALVDNLSSGRVGIAFASGWHADDFVFFPEKYSQRKEIMYRDIETIQRLWRGDSITVRGGGGNQIEIRTLPRPIQPTLPIWITAAGNLDTFVRAGQLGAGVLTHLLGQSVEELSERVRAYRAALRDSGHAAETGHISLMLHTFIGRDREAVRNTVRQPFLNYLRSSISLIENLIRSLNLPLDVRSMTSEDFAALLNYAFDRYFETSALFGTPETCRPLLDRLQEIGIDEIACLIDFGVPSREVLAHLNDLNELKQQASTVAPVEDYSLAAQAVRYGATMLQCTPSFMRMIALDPHSFEALQSVRVIMLGGEALPLALARQVKQSVPARLVNMYGPTETTVWSATGEIDALGNSVPIGRPILNTQLYILDRHLQPVPVGVAGELYIGGEGLARGYLNRPGLTAGAFIPDPFGSGPGGNRPGSRLYRTGDRVRYCRNGEIEFLGRKDHQIKLRGFRIELPEIEAVLCRFSPVREAVAIIPPGDDRLIAFVVARAGSVLDTAALQQYLRTQLPAYMVPQSIVELEALPLTSNGKVDRKRLPALQERPSSSHYVAPQNSLQENISAIWRDLLRLDQIGIHENFFDLGGHSLLMAQAQSQLRDRLQRNVPMVKLLEHPTISSLAGYLAGQEPARPALQQSIDRAQRQLESRRRSRSAAAVQQGAR